MLIMTVARASIICCDVFKRKHVLSEWDKAGSIRFMQMVIHTKWITTHLLYTETYECCNVLNNDKMSAVACPVVTIC